MGLIVDEAVNITRDCKAKWKVRRGKRGTQQKQEVNRQPRIFPKRSQRQTKLQGRWVTLVERN